MRALQFRRSIPRFAWTRVVGQRFPGVALRWGSQLRLATIDEPSLPSPSWVRVRPLLSGICGSDLAIITGSASPYVSALTSFPFVPGHEIVGEVTEVGPEAGRARVGDRVVVEPLLGCTVRGFTDPCWACAEGNLGNCERVTQGDLEAGLQTGYCRTTGGGWSTELVAHESQLHPVADDIPDEAAVLAEPLGCALRGVHQGGVREGDTVLVVGCGTVGLLTIAALRAWGPPCTVIAVAKHRHQIEAARALGADQIVPPGGGGYPRLAELTHATLHPLPLHKPAVVGGVSVTFDCIGSGSSLAQSLRWTRARGTVVLLGMPGHQRIDLSPLWYQEVRLLGSYASCLEHAEDGNGDQTIDMALKVLGSPEWGDRLRSLVTHRFPITRYRQAIRTALSAGASGGVKTVFDLTDSASGRS